MARPAAAVLLQHRCRSSRTPASGCRTSGCPRADHGIRRVVEAVPPRIVVGVQIIGLGTDLVEVARFRLAMERRGDRLLERLFSDEERAYADRQKDPSKS